MKAEANGNLVSDLAMPNRILSYLIFVVTKIAKGGSRTKQTCLFFIYTLKDSERRAQRQMEITFPT